MIVASEDGKGKSRSESSRSP